MKDVISTPRSPKAIGPYSQAIKANGFVFVSSQLAIEINFAVRREFPIHENLKLQFRAEAFNLFNHPNFGRIDSNLGDATFGQATATLAQSLPTVSPLYQQGGARSMQFALKLIF